MDEWVGNSIDPRTLNKYLYAHAEPINGIDPSGNITKYGQLATLSGVAILGSIAQATYSSFISGGEGDARSGGVDDIFEGMRFISLVNSEVAKAAAIILAVTHYQFRPERHHTIPKYLCGAEKQVLSAISHPTHVIIHRALSGVQIAYESGRTVQFGRRRNPTIQKLAEVREGRALIAKGIESAYTQLGVWGEGRPTIGMAFGVEKPKFVSGASSSCPVED